MIDYTQAHWRGVPRPQSGMTQAQYIEALRRDRREAEQERKHRRSMTAINVIGYTLMFACVFIGSLWTRHAVMTETAQKCVADMVWCQDKAGGAR